MFFSVGLTHPDNIHQQFHAGGLFLRAGARSQGACTFARLARAHARTPASYPSEGNHGLIYSSRFPYSHRPGLRPHLAHAKYKSPLLVILEQHLSVSGMLGAGKSAYEMLQLKENKRNFLKWYLWKKDSPDATTFLSVLSHPGMPTNVGSRHTCYPNKSPNVQQ